MLAEALQLLINHGKTAAGHTLVKIPGDRTLVRAPDGTSQVYDNDRPLAFTVAGLPDLAAIVGFFHAESARVVAHEAGVVMQWDADRLGAGCTSHMAHLKLVPAPAFQWATMQPFSGTPKEAVRLLRQLPNVPKAVIDSLRRVDFARASGVSTTVERKRETLGRTVELTVQQADEIPEYFDLRIDPVYMNEGFEGTSLVVRILIDLDLENQRVELWATPSETALAERMAAVQRQKVIAAALPTCLVLSGS